MILGCFAMGVSEDHYSPLENFRGALKRPDDQTQGARALRSVKRNRCAPIVGSIAVLARVRQGGVGFERSHRFLLKLHRTEALFRIEVVLS